LLHKVTKISEALLKKLTNGRYDFTNGKKSSTNDIKKPANFKLTGLFLSVFIFSPKKNYNTTKKKSADYF